MKVRLTIEVPGLGVRIKEAREQAGLSREQLGKAIGCSREWLFRIEGEERSISASMLRRIEGAIGCRLVEQIKEEV